MKIIGISGKRQSGKNTAAEFLMGKASETAEIVCFADELKDIVCRCFGARTDDLWGTDTDKEKILPCGKSGREILQIIGTDWFRKLDPNCWIRPYKLRAEEISKFCPLIITPDVRFPNEVQRIQDMGGHVIRLLRAPFPDDRHESETALDLMQERTLEGFNLNGVMFDAIIIDNRKMTIDQQNEAVWKLVNERNWI